MNKTTTKQFYFSQGGLPTFYLNWEYGHDPICYHEHNGHITKTVAHISEAKLASKLYDTATEKGYSYTIPDHIKQKHNIGLVEGIEESVKISAIAQPKIQDVWSTEQVKNNKIKNLLKRCKQKGIIYE